MPTSQSMRNMYPEFVIGGVTTKWKVTGIKPKCDYSSATGVKFLASESIGGGITLRFHPVVANWGRALAAVMFHHGYKFREMSGGTLSCRKITGSSKTSLHAHGVAIDFNPSKNRYRRQFGPVGFGRQTDMSPEMIHDIETKILTLTGKKVTQWGGRWRNIKDPMHFQPSQVSRTQLEKGINFTKVPGWGNYLAWENGEQMIAVGDTGKTVSKIQKGLNGWNKLNGNIQQTLVVDGVYGVKTMDLVSAYQKAADLPRTGSVDGITMALLMEYVPDWIDNHTPPTPPAPTGIQPGDKVTITGRIE